MNEEIEQQGEYATEIEWEAEWSGGAPMPQVFSNGSKVYLIYYLSHRAGWDGEVTALADSGGKDNDRLALITFDGDTFRFGITTDEAFHGLPLWNNGLQYYGAHIIKNSAWIQEVKEINMVHDNFKEETWASKNHYCLLFHDEIFEVIAKGYTTEVFSGHIYDLAVLAARRMNGD